MTHPIDTIKLNMKENLSKNAWILHRRGNNCQVRQRKEEPGWYKVGGEIVGHDQVCEEP